MSSLSTSRPQVQQRDALLRRMPAVAPPSDGISRLIEEEMLRDMTRGTPEPPTLKTLEQLIQEQTTTIPKPRQRPSGAPRMAAAPTDILNLPRQRPTHQQLIQGVVNSTNQRPQVFRMSPEEEAETIKRAPRRSPHNIPFEQLGDALYKTESAMNHSAESPKGAIGAMQLMPETAIELARKEGIENFTLDMLYDPAINKRLGMRYLKDLLTQFNGDPNLALAAYNWGPGSVSRALEATRGRTINDIWSRMPRETRAHLYRTYYQMDNDVRRNARG